ncbi:MAG: hypothetical protein QOC73_1118, partial [Actinomycetota bacterium]|nr:hypothetical protein [Actinomycetota bacterium]
MNLISSRRLTRLTAFVGASSAALATWAVAGSPAAVGATPSTVAISSSGALQHVVVLLKNQHDNLPAGHGTIAARVQATNSDQAPLVARARADGGTAIRQLHVANAFAVTISQAGVSDLANDPAVASIVPDLQVTKSGG